MSSSIEEMWAEVEKRNDSLPPAVAKPCTECPWVRTARPGHLGPATAEEWCHMAHGESPIACHMTIKHDDQDWSELRQCAGAAIFRANVFKSPRHPNIARAPRDTDLVFGWDDEFIDHHTGEPDSDDLAWAREDLGAAASVDEVNELAGRRAWERAMERARERATDH